ncbi:tRNA 5'-guanylyltransferase (plasmid) [Embleya sp. NBC_00888]|uniref:tRNA(His) guanylyltransferase Thg1 family protein n=1 Tax=Embleya sp. NBC_00888 TaxID=2975960 RepID=UPI002F91086F|nr:tRNA 5'-guanylyltransferase [Embleya sp. NBC_00888]
MDADRFEASQRSREWFHSLVLLPGAWTVIRVDGRSFSRFTEQHFDKPFDERFAALMDETAQALFTELDARYAYTESDEISILLDPSFDMFGREVEKLVSVTAGIASATFTHRAGIPAHFDSRIWMGTGVSDVVDYFSWRQADAARCALDGWCYWTLRKDGRSARAATHELARLSKADKNELLFAHDVNFNELPAWQRRGVGVWWESFERIGYDPVREIEVSATRRRVRVERELPMKDEYRALIAALADPTP